MCGSMVDIQSATAEIRRGKKEDRKKKQDKNIMSASPTQGGHKKPDQRICTSFSALANSANEQMVKTQTIRPTQKTNRPTASNSQKLLLLCDVTCRLHV